MASRLSTHLNTNPDTIAAYFLDWKHSQPLPADVEGSISVSGKREELYPFLKCLHYRFGSSLFSDKWFDQTHAGW